MRTPYGETYGISATPIPTAKEFQEMRDEIDLLLAENERLRALPTNSLNILRAQVTAIEALASDLERGRESTPVARQIAANYAREIRAALAGCAK